MCVASTLVFDIAWLSAMFIPVFQCFAFRRAIYHLAPSPCIVLTFLSILEAGTSKFGAFCALSRFNMGTTATTEHKDQLQSQGGAGDGSRQF